MEKISFDTGVKEYEINGSAILRFNPSDPNVYARFLDAIPRIQALGSEYLDQAKSGENQTSPAEICIKAMQEVDSKAKDILNEVFGCGNDFHKIFAGVNVVALRLDGKTRVIDGFFEAMRPIMEGGIKLLVDQENAAVEKYAGDLE